MSQSYMPQAKSDVHLTPDRVYDLIKKHWNYSKEQMFDPCPENHTWDGLDIGWHWVNYVNPPYTLLREFVAKAILESKLNTKTIMLLPSKTDQHWFHTIIDYEIHFIEKRLKFKNNKWSATQPHFLVMIE